MLILFLKNIFTATSTLVFNQISGYYDLIKSTQKINHDISQILSMKSSLRTRSLSGNVLGAGNKKMYERDDVLLFRCLHSEKEKC